MTKFVTGPGPVCDNSGTGLGSEHDKSSTSQYIRTVKEESRWLHIGISLLKKASKGCDLYYLPLLMKQTLLESTAESIRSWGSWVPCL